MKDLFDCLDKENKQEQKQLKTKNTHFLDLILGGWNAVLNFNDCGFYEDYTIKQCYEKYEKYAPENCSSADIKTFLFHLKDYQHENSFCTKSGLYLSALINHMQDEKISISFEQFDQKLDFFGYNNKGKSIYVFGSLGVNICQNMHSGKVVVDGNVFGWAGEHMDGGALIVKGSAGLSVGHRLDGGNISIHGSVKSYAGSYMKGGSIEIHGVADDNVGHGMIGGTISMHGGFISLGTVIYGKIYSNNKLIVNNEKHG